MKIDVESVTGRCLGEIFESYGVNGGNRLPKYLSFETWHLDEMLELSKL